jgi:hypothetical protein
MVAVRYLNMVELEGMELVKLLLELLSGSRQVGE